MIESLNGDLRTRFGLTRAPRTSVLAILFIAPLMGLAMVEIPETHAFPGVILVAVGLGAAYFAGPLVALVALVETLAVAAALGVEPAHGITLGSGLVAFVVAGVAGTALSAAFARERRSRQEAVESEGRYRSLLEGAFDAIVLSVDGAIVDVNGGFEKLTDLQRSDLIGRPIADLLLDMAAPSSVDAVRAYLGTDEPGPVELIVSLGARRGRIIRVLTQSVLFEGKVARLAAIADVTEQRDAEAEQASADARYRALFESAAVAVTVASVDGTYLEANEVFCALVGRPRDQLVGHHFSEFRGQPEPGDLDLLGAILRGEQGPFVYESRLADSEGMPIPVRVNVSLVHDDLGDPLYTISVFESIAEQRRLEDQIRQAQKMEAVGQLAGGIAHDFNNLLTVIGGNVMLINSGDLSPEAREYAAEIAAAAERAGVMTRQLLTFSRKQELRLDSIDLNHVVKNVLQLIRRLLGPAVEIVLDLQRDLRHVFADAGQLEQVLINLAVNARDAMPEGGRLTIATTADGNAIAVSVADTGIGMDDATRERIFEPFFTTKDAGEGTGLGLSTVYGIVRQSGGQIRVESAPGKGSTFTVALPAAPEAVTVATVPPLSDRAHPASARMGRVLLVDDEPGVRTVAARALTRAGHVLVLAGSGQEALELLETEQPIDLLITDLAMPGMNGLELAERVHDLHPGMPVLYISGYADQVLAAVRPADGSFEVLEKPFTPAELTARVAKALAGGLPPTQRSGVGGPRDAGT
jgi:two-component system cell cycle sensor histidine kinase/response regulator CckA